MKFAHGLVGGEVVIELTRAPGSHFNDVNVRFLIYGGFHMVGQLRFASRDNAKGFVRRLGLAVKGLTTEKALLIFDLVNINLVPLTGDFVDAR